MYARNRLVQRQRCADVQQQRTVRPDRGLRGSEAVLRWDDDELRGMHRRGPVRNSERLLYADLHWEDLRRRAESGQHWVQWGGWEVRRCRAVQPMHAEHVDL